MTDRKPRRKVDFCPTCIPDVKGAIFRHDYADDENGVWGRCWVCQNCGHTQFIKPRSYSRQKGIRPAQQNTIDAIRRRMERDTSYQDGTANEYEWKNWEITETDYGSVWLNAERGMKGDEGTVAEILCRRRYHGLVGPRGGTKYVSEGS